LQIQQKELPENSFQFNEKNSNPAKKVTREQLQACKEIVREQLQTWQRNYQRTTLSCQKKLLQNNSNPSEEITREQIQAQ
ncbi:6948_t:CDS:2, partial [Gigaspora margarita]